MSREFKDPNYLVKLDKAISVTDKVKAGKARKDAIEKKNQAYKKKVSEGKVGKRSLKSGQSGGIGYYKETL